MRRWGEKRLVAPVRYIDNPVRIKHIFDETELFTYMVYRYGMGVRNKFSALKNDSAGRTKYVRINSVRIDRSERLLERANIVAIRDSFHVRIDKNSTGITSTVPETLLPESWRKTPIGIPSKQTGITVGDNFIGFRHSLRVVLLRQPFTLVAVRNASRTPGPRLGVRFTAAGKWRKVLRRPIPADKTGSSCVVVTGGIRYP